MKKLIIILPFLLSLASCSYYTYYPQAQSQTYAATNPDSIKVHSGDIDQEYIIIGSVASLIPGYFYSEKAIERANKLLKENSAKIGADAIIHTRLNGTGRGISGVAVKFK
jgi:hypothetical protein